MTGWPPGECIGRSPHRRQGEHEGGQAGRHPGRRAAWVADCPGDEDVRGDRSDHLRARGEQTGAGGAFGAEHVLDPNVDDVVERAREITGGRGFDLIVEASGAPEAAESAYEIAAPGATVLYIAGYPNGYLLPVPITTLFGPKELIFSGVFRSPYTFPRAFQLLPKMDLRRSRGTSTPWIVRKRRSTPTPPGFIPKSSSSAMGLRSHGRVNRPCLRPVLGLEQTSFPR